MAKKTLNIVESAYRAVMEEQDDTILWLLAAMQGAGGGAHRGAARQRSELRGRRPGSPGLTVGEWKQTQAPKMDRDVLDLIEKRKIPVYVVDEDLADRGIERSELVPGVQLLSRTALPASSPTTRWSPTGSRGYCASTQFCPGEKLHSVWVEYKRRDTGWVF